MIFFLSGCGSFRKETLSPYKATSRPYKIRGKWHYPQQHYEYEEMGLASWYGPGFHGKKTAVGEVFNQNQLTAAHRTLPLPSIALVTNLENGRMIKVRVNDRGPFVDHLPLEGRIIDVSKKAAELLGFLNKGTAKVRVESVVDESIALHSGIDEKDFAVGFMPHQENKISVKSLDGGSSGRELKQNIQPSSSLLASSLSSAKEKDLPAAVLQGRPQAFRQIYMDVGAFGKRADAERLLKKLSVFGRCLLKPIRFGVQNVYQVRMGPFLNVEKADSMLQRTIKIGHRDARLVVE